MKKLTKRQVNKKRKPNPLFESLTDYLKDPANYEKIENELASMLKTDHKHKTVKEYVTCMWCQKKRELRQNRMRVMGFTSPEQFLEWRKIMQIIIKKANFQVR